MYETSAELAENKLLVLYVIKSLKQPISNTQLTEIILENNNLNFLYKENKINVKVIYRKRKTIHLSY